MKEDKEPDLSRTLKKLEDMNADHLQCGARVLKSGNNQLHVLDMLAIPICNRSMSLVEGFGKLLPTNFICAAPLIRLQMDNLLRFYASSLVEDSNTFVLRVMDGAKISGFRDKDTGKQLYDSYLKKKLSKKIPWISDVYEHTSGYIHLSSKHIFNAMRTTGKPYEMEAKVGKEDSIIPVKLKVEAVETMIELTKLVLRSLEDWAAHKDRYYGSI